MKRVFSLAKHLPEGRGYGKGCVNLFFFCGHSQVGGVGLSLYELNKGTLTARPRGRVL